MTLERRTDRLLLRRWREADREPFAELNADPEVMQFFPATLSRAESDAMVTRIEHRMRDNGWGLWALEVTAGEHAGRFAGFTGLARPTWNPAFTEVGWRLPRWAWGHGYATEAAREALRVGFEELRLDEIVSFTTPTNQRSRAVMERLGMTRDPADDFDYPTIAEGHPLRRSVLYRLQRNDWLLSGRSSDPGTYSPT
ncbi:GNAT family N-acetyltransferase [Cellulomonas sp. P5_E12]